MNSGAAMCAVAGAATMLNGHCAAQKFVAADYATNSAYAGGWADGQNGGYGFGPWSFYNTDPTPGALQTMSTASALGRAWTLFTITSTNGLANAGRAISEPGGLQVGQTIETFIVNPLNTQFFRGWTISFQNNTNNNPGGVSTGEQVSVYHFEYFNYGRWQTSDFLGNHDTSLVNTDTNPDGMKIDLTLTATNAYHVVLTPLNNPTNTFTQDGNLKTGAPINWIYFNCYNTATTGPNDIADNFEISRITIAGTMLNIQRAGASVVFSWTTNTPGFVLASSPSLGAGAVWNTNLPSPVVINGHNVVTNPISGPKQFYRLQLKQ
jgi:hypothetical protein